MVWLNYTDIKEVEQGTIKTNRHNSFTNIPSPNLIIR